MSFASDTKKEICREIPENACCQKAQAYGLWLFTRGFSLQENAVVTENGSVARLMAESAAEEAGVMVEMSVSMHRKESGFDRVARELVRRRGTVENPENVRVEFTEAGMILSDGNDEDAQCFEYPEFFFVCETCALLVPVCGQRALVLQKKDLEAGSMEQLRAFLQEQVSYEQLETA